jgi:cysteinyl-tRNA synthetase
VPYRKSLNFTMDGLKSAAIAIERLRNFKLRLETDRFVEGFNEQLAARTAEASKAFTDSLNDDLNTAEALAAAFEFVRDANSTMDSGEFRAGNAPAALEFLGLFDSIFRVLEPSVKPGALLDSDIEARVAQRTAAKKARNFALSDQIRDELLEQGIILEDTKSGVRWKRK